jgi:hypothetical protein
VCHLYLAEGCHQVIILEIAVARVVKNSRCAEAERKTSEFSSLWAVENRGQLARLKRGPRLIAEAASGD